MLVVQIKPEIPKNAVPVRLSKKMTAYVSPADFVLVKNFYWRAIKSSGNYYAVARKVVKGKLIHIRMHRLITNCPDYMKVHHIDHNTLNNCRENLQVISERAHRCLDGWHYFEH
jgi:hypothetical protein